MIGQVISYTTGLSLFNTGESRQFPQVEEVSSEEKGQSHNQPFITHKAEVNISKPAMELSLRNEAEEPNWEQVQAMASQLSNNMDSMFLKAGIDTSQAIRINIHPFSGIPFVGDHPDKSRIQSLLDNTPSVLEQIKNVNALASYSYRASQAVHGAVSSAVGINSQNTEVSAKLQSALQQYEQSSQITRLSMEYQKDIGITLDVMAGGKR